MGLLQELPDPQQILNILGRITGSEAENTGLNAVLRLLTDIDTDTMASSFASQLDNTVSSNFSTNGSSLTEEILGNFNQALDSLPSDSGQLVSPLLDRLGSIRNLTTTELSERLLVSIGGFQNIQSLIPTDMRTLLSGAAEGMSQLKDQLISGEWGGLRQWSESVQGLYDEMSPLFTGGSGTVEDRLIAFLSNKMTDLVRILFPRQQGIAERISNQLDHVISPSHVNTLQTIKSDLINHINQTKTEFDNGNFTNTTHLASAEAGFQQLADELSDILSGLSQTLNTEGARAEGMTRALQQQFADFDEVEIVDLGNIRDMFVNSLNRAEEALRELNLEVVRDTIENVFNRINEGIDQFDFGRLTETIENLQNQIQSVLDGLDAALFEVIASIRNVFSQIKEALRSIASALGSYDEEGQFHFHIVREIEDFLRGIKSALQENVQPMLDQFKDTVDRTLQEVQKILSSVQGQIDSVKGELQSILQGVSDQLEDLDVTGEIEEIRQKMDEMLSRLGEIDFNPVVDPVVGQINGMRDGLREIDLSSLNDFLKNTLRISVQLVKEIDFTENITNVLLKEINEILEIPKNGLSEIEEKIENTLAKLTEFDPGIILKPLDDLFDPVTERLNALQLEKILEPLDEWHARIKEELDKLSPSFLLHPVIELYDQLKSTFQSISPEELIQPLQEGIDDFKSELQRLDITGITDDLGNVLNRVNNILDEISPENLFAPLVNGFDKIIGAIDRFSPGTLLEPFANIFEPLMAPLDNLTEEHVRLIGEAFSEVRTLPAAYDPQHNFQTIQQKYSEIQGLIQQMNVGQIISDLRGPYNALKASFDAGGSAGAGIEERVNSLDPLRSETINRVSSELQQFQSQIQNAFSEATPPADLMSRFEEIRPSLESLIPTWVRDDMTPSSVREAFRRANPLNITEEVNQLYETFREQLQNFDPRILQENVQETFDNLRETLRAVDPEIIINRVQDVINNLSQRLDSLDLRFIVDELEDLTEEVETLIHGLNPRPIIQQLEELTNEIKGIVDELKPSEVLSALNEPFQTAKDIVESFNPEFLKEPLLDIYEGIQDKITEIDIGIILKPLDDRLNDLRDELEEGLDRSGTAFNGMIAAIPV